MSDGIKMAQEAFATQKWVAIRGLFSPEALGLFKYYTLFEERRWGSKLDGVVGNAHSRYGDPLMESIMVVLHPVVEQVTQRRLLPSYAFYRNYRPGSDLHMHTDRPSCEYSVSMCLNYVYEDPEYQWPLYIEDHPVVMNPGDAIIYKGGELTHGRPALEGGESTVHSQTFIHYVDADGPYAEYEFDHRAGVGYPMVCQNPDCDCSTHPESRLLQIETRAE